MIQSGHTPFSLFKGPLFFLTTLLIIAGPVSAKTDPMPEIQPGTPAYVTLQQTVENVAASEKEAIRQITSQIEQIRQTRNAWMAAANAYRIQISAYTNMLATPSLQQRQINEAWNEVRAMATIRESLSESSDRLAEADEQLRLMEQQRARWEKQAEDLRKLPLKEPRARDLIENLQGLGKLSRTREKLIPDFTHLLRERSDMASVLKASFEELSAQFEGKIRASQKLESFRRNQSPLIISTQ